MFQGLQHPAPCAKGVNKMGHFGWSPTKDGLQRVLKIVSPLKSKAWAVEPGCPVAGNRLNPQFCQILAIIYWWVEFISNLLTLLGEVRWLLQTKRAPRWCLQITGYPVLGDIPLQNSFTERHQHLLITALSGAARLHTNRTPENWRHATAAYW